MRRAAALAAWLAAACMLPAQPVYIVHDDAPPMEALAAGFRRHGLDVRLEDQKTYLAAAENRPARAILMYVHGAFDPAAERRLIDYAERGGRLIVVHHGAASGKTASAQWLPFLGLKILPRNAPEHGWNVLRGEFQVVNLNPRHYVTSHGVVWDRRISYTPSDGPSAAQTLPAIVLPGTEAFLNQLFTDGRRKTVLLGMQAVADGKEYTQDRAGWLLPAGKGYVFYFQAGHQAADFEHPGYARILLNSVLWRPGLKRTPPVVAVDGFHNDEREPHYRWDATYAGGFSAFAELLRGMGAETRTLRERFTARSLVESRCLIVVDPDTPAESAAPRYISDAEVEAVAAWVNGGGRLVLLGNNQGNAEFAHFNRLARRFGIRFVETTARKADGDGRLSLEISALEPVFPRGGRAYVVDVAPLELSGAARALAREGGVPIMAMAEAGRGKVFALGDPWLYNEYIDREDNWRLGSELFRYLLFD